MPIYTYECTACKAKDDLYRKMADRDSPALCACGKAMDRIISAPMVTPPMPEYYCVVTDQMVTSRNQRRNIIAEHQLIEKG